MGKFRGLDTQPGWINRQQQQTRRDIRELRAEQRLRTTSFASVPAGAIPLPKLSSPSAPGVVYLTATGFALATAGANVIDSTVTVPAGFSSCVVSITGRVFVYNSTATADAVQARPVVAGLTGNAVPVTAQPAAPGLNLAPFSTVLTGLTPGSTFTLQLWAASVTAAWATDPANTADLSGVLLWFT